MNGSGTVGDIGDEAGGPRAMEPRAGGIIMTNHPKNRGARPCAVAGFFYPGDPGRVLAHATRLLDAAALVLADTPWADRAPKAIITPHAGWRYSGDLAALAWQTLAPTRGRVRRVVLLGPTHRVPVLGAALPDADAFETLLGDLPIPVDDVLTATADLPIRVGIDAATHHDEHALEVQTPFIRLLLGEVDLVPLNVSSATADEAADLIDALWGDDGTVIAVSTDLSHYLPYDQAEELDRRTIARILALDPTIGHDRACGATPLNGLLESCRRRGLCPELLGAHNSGDVSDDRSRVVGYAAFAIEEDR